MSGINSFGIGKSKDYSNNTSYKITAVGDHTVYGYVKDNAGNENTCSIKVSKQANIEYQYSKNIARQYSAWSNWTTLTYDPANKPAFGLLISVVAPWSSVTVSTTLYSPLLATGKKAIIVTSLLYKTPFSDV